MARKRFITFSPFLLLGQGPVSIVEFFADPKNGTLGTNKPNHMKYYYIILSMGSATDFYKKINLSFSINFSDALENT